MTDFETDILDQTREFQALIRRSRLILSSLVNTLTDLLERAIDGDVRAVKEMPLKAAELETALRRADDIERKYLDWHAKHAGTLAAGALDLDAAREEIARRLARIHATRDAGDPA
ncbi:hypothetical protein [Roseisalinus antarcticus]|uniref:Uncharacterized protein n=1 Tax=Roseisalinus antarcticus TaxID=254357 RepID=A0A1Y5T3P4_9RHOB|nr:hypothetical protein [Roseisalinus antarcticus]SLN54618.1 hypothetical protein ROA7023_02453 [Roseisalinus antarcticus]